MTKLISRRFSYFFRNDNIPYRQDWHNVSKTKDFGGIFKSVICLKLTGNLLYPPVTPILSSCRPSDQPDQKMKIEESDVLALFMLSFFFYLYTLLL